jgi:hypothetical protein
MYINFFFFIIIFTLSREFWSSHMTQSIKKANCGDHIDRISDLPSNVIDGILKHLNIQQLVSTSILSRKWRYMWMSVPELDFSENVFFRFMIDDRIDSVLEILRILCEIWIYYIYHVLSINRAHNAAHACMRAHIYLYLNLVLLLGKNPNFNGDSF